MQPARDMIVVDALPGGTLDPSVDRSLPLDKQTGSVVGIDATFPFGAEIRTAGARPVSRDICGPALAEKGHEYIEVADVPGWREYEFPELKGRGAEGNEGLSHPQRSEGSNARGKGDEILRCAPLDGVFAQGGMPVCIV